MAKQSKSRSEWMKYCVAWAASGELHGIDPYDYLKDVLVRTVSHPQRRIAALLPMNWLKRILVAHDTTGFDFDIHDEFAREYLAKLSAKRQSFLWHASLAITADEFLAPMGLITSRPFVHSSQLADEHAVKMWQEIDGILDNEQRRRRLESARLTPRRASHG